MSNYQYTEFMDSPYYQKLTLRKINKLKKLSILKKAEELKRRKLIRQMYGKQSESQI